MLRERRNVCVFVRSSAFAVEYRVGGTRERRDPNECKNQVKLHVYEEEPAWSSGHDVGLSLQKPGFESRGRYSIQKTMHAVAPPPNGDRGPVLIVKRTKPTSVVPWRASENAAGYDLCASQAHDLQPYGLAVIETGLILQIPEGFYGRITSNSFSRYIDVSVEERIIEYDFDQEVTILIRNNGPNTYHIKVGDQIAQLITEKIWAPKIVVSTPMR